MNKSIRIYFTSDLHGYFFPTSYADTTPRDMGLFKCASHFKKDGNTLIIDGGDILQGSAFAHYCHSEYGTNLPIADIMNRCEYDFVTIGNHDFNYGTDYLNTYIRALNARCVCQNVCAKRGECVYPFQIRTMENGLRVGVAGIVTDHVTVWEKPENLRNVRVENPFIAAKTALETMKKHCDITVCVYHGGFERDLETGTVLSASMENIAWRICDELDYDILLTGHQHVSIQGRQLNGTFVMQPAENGKEFHLLEACVDSCGRKAISAQRVPAHSMCEPALCAVFKPLDDRVQKWLDEPVGHMERPLVPGEHIEMAVHGNGIADFLNHIQLYYTGAEVSAVSLANDVAGFDTEVTRRNILATYPFPNSLLVLEITARMLRSAIERSAEYFTLEGDGLRVSERYQKPKVEHYNYDYFAGIRYTIDVLKPLGKRVVELTRAGKPLRDDELLSICVNNYRASGAGGYPMYPQCRVLRHVNTDMTDLMLDYFSEHPNVSKGDMEKSAHSFRVVKGNEVL